MAEKTEGRKNDTIIVIVICLIIAVVILFITGGFGFLTKSPIVMTDTSGNSVSSGTLVNVYSGGKMVTVDSAKFTEGQGVIMEDYSCLIKINGVIQECSTRQAMDAFHYK